MINARVTPKRIILIVLVIALAMCLCTSAFAYTITTTHTIDNDDEQGYTTVRYGFDTWFQASTLYYQDARKQSCVAAESTNYSERYRYEYRFTSYQRSTPIVAILSVYLYNTSFTDPNAYYSISTPSSYTQCSVGYINQDLAAAGWNQFESVVQTLPLGGTYITDRVTLEPSTGNSAKYCGADAIKIELGYN